MNALLRPVVALLALAMATSAAAQGISDAARLHLVLDPDGRIRLATSALEGYGAPPLRQAPLPRLNPQHPLQPNASGAPSLRLDFRASHADAELAPCLSADLIRLAPFGACELASYRGLPGTVTGGELDLQFDAGGGVVGVNLNYGLSWLDPAGSTDTARVPFAVLSAPSVTSHLLFPHQFESALGPTPLRSERYGLGAFIPLGPSLRLDLGYQHSRGLNADIQPGLAPWLLSSQDSVSLGLSWGRFQGNLTGRQQRPLDPMLGAGSESLDLGLSWRMPWWNAELEFGARNLLVRPGKPEGAERALEQGDLRTPYLRYHQEL